MISPSSKRTDNLRYAATILKPIEPLRPHFAANPRAFTCDNQNPDAKLVLENGCVCALKQRALPA